MILKVININTYELFLKHGSECLWDNDSRERRPKGTCEITDKMFSTLEAIDHNLEIISTGLYSKKMELKFKKEIDTLKLELSEEVWNIMENKYKKEK